MIDADGGGNPAGGTVEMRYLMALIAVGRNSSFSRAAEVLGYTQSAVSQQIARLEQIVGHRLIERPKGARRVSLTAAGDILLGHAEAVVARLASASADLGALASGEAGVLRIGCFQSVGVRILPRVIRKFAAERPNVRIELTEAEDDAELLRAVERGDLDLTFMVFPMMEGPFASVELLEDPYVVVVRPDSPLALCSSPITLRQLEGLPLVTYAQMREAHAIENRLGHPELTRQIVFRSNDNGTILGLAAEGIGTAVISSLSVDPNRGGIRALPLAGVSPRVVGIAWHRERYRNPAADSFVRVAQQNERPTDIGS
jgi:DNA-binding transcriptional LysR family regulator